MVRRVSILWAVWVCLQVAAVPLGAAQDGELPDAEPASQGPTLVRAVMCESLEGYEPTNIAVVFSVEVGKVSCYTAFENIPSTSYAVHKWFRQEEPVTSKRLMLKPPRWSTYSSIQLRETDKGPWRVEVWDADGRLLKTLRFSVTQ